MTQEWPMATAGSEKDKDDEGGMKKGIIILKESEREFLDYITHEDLFRAGFHDIFKRYEKGEDRINEIKKLFPEFMREKNAEGEEIGQKLDACKDIKDRREFVKKAFEACLPIIKQTYEKTVKKN